MFMDLTRAWVATDTCNYVYIEVHGNSGIETRYSHDTATNSMQYQIRYFDTAFEAFRAMEQLHEDKSYEEI